MKIPADWSTSLGQQFRGRVRFMRPFGRPTGLTPSDRIELVIAHVDAWADVYLGARPLGAIPTQARDSRFEIPQHQLGTRNRLVVEVELPHETADSAPLPRGTRTGMCGGIIGEVRLEIFPSGAS